MNRRVEFKIIEDAPEDAPVTASIEAPVETPVETPAETLATAEPDAIITDVADNVEADKVEAEKVSSIHPQPVSYTHLTLPTILLV